MHKTAQMHLNTWGEQSECKHQTQEERPKKVKIYKNACWEGTSLHQTAPLSYCDIIYRWKMTNKQTCDDPWRSFVVYHRDLAVRVFAQTCQLDRFHPVYWPLQLHFCKTNDLTMMNSNGINKLRCQSLIHVGMCWIAIFTIRPEPDSNIVGN